MNTLRLLTSVFGILIASALLAAPADAQSGPQGAPKTTAQKKRAPAAKPPETPVAAVTPVVVAEPAILPALPLESTALIEQKCLRALNGTCTNPLSVESARLRAEIIPAVRVSYFGTPAGTVGGSYIPFERLFQDNPLLFGLPTFTATFPCCITRSK
jgi:hypothetical protein